MFNGTLYTRVILETPYAGDVALNMRYLNACMRDCIILHDEAPFASHGLYTGALNDECPSEREIGIYAGFAWAGVADRVVVYTDLGISEGMQKGIENHRKIGLTIEYRKLPEFIFAQVKAG